jgi:aminopeptidase N
LEHAPLFALEVPVLAVLGDGTEVASTLAFDSPQQTFHLSLAQAPTMLLVDPRGDLLWTTDWSLPEPMLRTILQQGPTAGARMQAAFALGKRGGAHNTEALAVALSSDASWCVQLEAARTLGKLGTTQAFAALQGAANMAHPKARRAVRAALGQWPTREAAQTLADLLQRGDASYLVEAETATALGRTRQPLAFDALVSALDRSGWNETVRVGVLDGLAALQDARALEVIAPWLAKPHHTLLRCAAVRALCAFTTEPARVVDLLGPWTSDTGFRFALTLAASLGGLGDGRAVRLLQQVAERAVDGRIKRRAEESIAQVRAGQGPGKQVDGLRTDVDAMRTALRELSDRVAAGEKLRTA